LLKINANDFIWKDNIYIPILKAFKKELNRIYKTDPKKVACNLVKYLVGRFLSWHCVF
jgi:hypothetical protein